MREVDGLVHPPCNNCPALLFKPSLSLMQHLHMPPVYGVHSASGDHHCNPTCRLGCCRNNLRGRPLHERDWVFAFCARLSRNRVPTTLPYLDLAGIIDFRVDLESHRKITQ